MVYRRALVILVGAYLVRSIHLHTPNLGIWVFMSDFNPSTALAGKMDEKVGNLLV